MTASLYQSGSLTSCDFALFAILRPSTDPPDSEGKLRIEPHALVFPGPDEGVPAHQVLRHERILIGAAKFPQRNFDIRLLRGIGIETNRDEDDIFPAGARLLEEHDIVVPGVQKRKAEMRMKCGILASNPVQRGDFPDDTAQALPVP